MKFIFEKKREFRFTSLARFGIFPNSFNFFSLQLSLAIQLLSELLFF